MTARFTKKIAPFVKDELMLAVFARKQGHKSSEFKSLENAHVIGQESTYWHVKVHVLMFFWSVRNRQFKEMIGQIFRIVGAATKTAFGFVPKGNTGGSNVSPFKVMPIRPEHQTIIDSAKSSD